jgi:hypothetical protein
LKFRRKQDRIILGLAIVVILGGFWAYTQGCTSKGPTIPDPVVNQPAPPAPVAVNPQPVQPVVPTATPKPELPLWVNCDAATGICTFGTDKPRPVSAKCTKPAENDPFYGTWSAVINDGDTVDVRNICHKIEPNDCSPKTVPVQIDFQGMGRHLGHLGPLYQLTFPQKLDPKECEECVEWKEPKISCGEYGECHPHPAVLAPACFEHAECLKTWNCKDPEPFEDTRSCVCKECIEEGPYEGDIVWDETIHEGRCPVVSALNGVPLECHQNGTQTITARIRPRLRPAGTSSVLARSPGSSATATRSGRSGASATMVIRPSLPHRVTRVHSNAQANGTTCTSTTAISAPVKMDRSRFAILNRATARKTLASATSRTRVARTAR